jgi:Ca2+/Na+ antiporter
MLPVVTPKNATLEIAMGLMVGQSIVNLAGALILTVLFSQKITAWKVAVVAIILGIGIGLLVTIATITKIKHVLQILL